MTQEQKPVLRFAPSPTGYLHIGGARTALFNWLYARHTGGVFQLRIEDTDRERSTKEAVDAILNGMRWLGLDWDGQTTFQFARSSRHREVADTLLAQGNAYRCYATPQELDEMRTRQRAEGKPVRYDGRWRDNEPGPAQANAPFVVRLKAPQSGETVVHDRVLGDVTFQNEQLDDMVLLRSDGTPTYMLSVVVDDHDSGVTHVIRGSDHLTNTFRQLQIYQACDWTAPSFAHIPLIHGPDGAKLSKRHGALGVDAYRDMGMLPEAMRNYLLRLGWGHGDAEIVSTEQAIEWFDLPGIGRSPARFDMAKLTSLNGHYLRQAEDARLVRLIGPFLNAIVGRPPAAADEALLLRAMAGLKERAKTLVELAEGAAFYMRARPIRPDDKAARLLDDNARAALASFAKALAAVQNWRQDVLEGEARRHCEAAGLALGKLAQPLRAALTGSTVSPPIFAVMETLGRDESLARIADVTGSGERGAPRA